MKTLSKEDCKRMAKERTEMLSFESCDGAERDEILAEIALLNSSATLGFDGNSVIRL